MTDSLKNLAENLFNEFELDDREIEVLLALENASSKKSSYIALLSKVVGIVTVAVFITVFSINQNSLYKKENMVHLIVAEVVNNHRYLKPLEVTSSQLLSVSKYFNQLSFSSINNRLFKSYQIWNLDYINFCYCMV